MRKSLKKIMTFALSAAMAVTGMSGTSFASAATKTNEGGAVMASSTNEVETPDNPSPYTDLSAGEIISEMGTGWNLGNTLEGHQNYAVGETVWQGAKTTKAFVKYVHDAGFNTIRIPVTWGNMINADYSINEEWMNRVQDVVDYATAENMYVVLNIHHDGTDNNSDYKGTYGDEKYSHGWLDITSDDETVWSGVKTKFAGVWKTIAERFKNYDEHLILESMNEVYIHGQGWTADAESISKQNKKINELNQIFVDTVRATGSNNAKRWLTVCSLNTNIKYALGNYSTSFEIPKDSAAGKIMVTVHDYDAYNKNSVNEATDASYANQFKQLKSKFVDKGVPVLVDEYGFQTKIIPDARACKFEGVNYLAKKYGMVVVAWDNNGAGSGESFRILNRYFNKPYSVKTVSAIMRGYFVDTEAPQYRFDASDGELAIIKMTSVKTDTDDVTLKVGEKKQITATTEPAGNNDVVLWKSDDSSVASVYNGKITATGVGTTTIHAYSQADAYDSSTTTKVEKTIKVTVEKTDLAKATTAITTDFDSYKLEEKQSAFINAIAKAADGSANGAAIRYSSSNEKIATVSRNGKIAATGTGVAVISVITADGFEKSINVTVGSVTESAYETNLGLRLYYFDEAANSYNYTDVATDRVAVKADGEYTLTIDADKDLNDIAKKALADANGNACINHIASLYIMDADVASQKLTKSQVQSGNIIYKKFVVNDTKEIEITNKEAKSVMSGTTFDTGNPLNVWDGSVISSGIESKTSSEGAQYLDFASDLGSVKKISVTFTLSGLSSMAASKDDEQPDSKLDEDDDNPNKNDNSNNGSNDNKNDNTNTSEAKNVKIGNVTYKYIKSSNKITGVEYASNSKKASLKTVSIPATITVGKTKYKVVKISNSVFKNAKKLTTVTIGSNVKQIGKDVFNGCTKLKSVKVNSKVITKVGANTFKKTASKLVIKVPSAKLSSYKKIFKGKGQSKKAVIKK